MQTAYDWLTLALFAGILTLFATRVRDRGAPTASGLAHFLVPAAACAVANYLGNKGMHLAALALLLGTAGYIAVCLFDAGVRRT